MPNAILYVGQSFAVKTVSCLTSIFDWNNPEKKIQHAKNLFKSARFFFPIIILNLWVRSQVWLKSC